MSDSEKRVLELANRGRTWPQIAALLGLTVGQVSSRWYTLKARLQISGGDRYDVVRHARAQGLIPTPKRGGMRESQTALSSYEAALLRGVAAGADPATLAKNLKRSTIAIYNMLRYLRRKFAAPTNIEAVERAIALGLLPQRALRAKNPLSNRETTILTYVALGWSAAEIAAELKVSRSNIKARFRLIKSKLRVNTLDDAILEADRHHFLDRAIVPAQTLRRLRTSRRQVTLTPRECDVVALLKRGVTQRERIAEALALTPNTVAAHVSRIRAKLGDGFPQPRRAPGPRSPRRPPQERVIRQSR